jgi:transcriptional regulator with XRE-family HTH domain
MALKYMLLLIMNTLGSKIKAIRLSCGLTQEDMADKLELSLPAYSKIERGLSDVNFKRLVQLAKIFKSTPEGIITHGEKSNQKDIRIKQLEIEVAVKDKMIMELQKELLGFYKKEKKLTR